MCRSSTSSTSPRFRAPPTRSTSATHSRTNRECFWRDRFRCRRSARSLRPRNFACDLTSDGTVNIGTNTNFIDGAEVINNNQFLVADGVTLNLSGEITNNDQFVVAEGATVNLSGFGAAFNQAGGNLLVNGSFVADAIAFIFSGGSHTGNPVVLEDSNVTIDDAATGNLDIVFTGPFNLFTGNVHAGQSVTFRGQDGSDSAQVIATGDVDVAGDLTLTSQDDAYAAKITAPEINIQTGGQLTVDAGTGGARTIPAAIINYGTAIFNANTDFTATSSTITNNNEFNIAVDVNVNTAGNTTFNQANGSLSGGGTLNIESGTFDYSGGDVDLAWVKLVDATLVMSGGTGPLDVSIAGFQNTITGEVFARQNISVTGDSDNGLANLNVFTTVTSSGTITLNSVDPASDARRSGTGLIVNNAPGKIDVNEGAGGARRINCSIENNSSVNINHDTTANGGNQTFTNNGIWTSAAGKTFSIIAFGSAFNQESGTLRIDGNCVKKQGFFRYNGGTFVSANPFQFENVTLEIGPNGTSRFDVDFVDFNNNIVGDVQTGQQFNVIGQAAQGAAKLRATTGLYCDGGITLTSTDPVSSTLEIFGGPLTIGGTGTLTTEMGGGGSRTISASIVNDGNTQILVDTATPGSNRQVTNNNIWFIHDDASYTVPGFNGSYINAAGGTTTVDGTLEVAVGSIRNEEDGFFRGHGTIRAQNLVSNAGTMSPGGLDLAGVMNVDTDEFLQETGLTGRVLFAICGLTQGSDYDALFVSGHATLGGTLEIGLINEFVPIVGDVFQIMTFGSNTGTFDEVVQPNTSGVTFTVRYNTNDITIEATDDFDGDGVPDGFDNCPYYSDT